MPAKAGIQYAETLRFNRERLGILGPSLRWDDTFVCCQSARTTSDYDAFTTGGLVSAGSGDL